jgi:hypothetical protein
MPSTEVATLCFHTRDAVERDDSKLTFEMPGDGLRTDAARVALASCEFPMVQYTIEEDYARLYLNHALRLEDEDARWIDLVIRAPHEAEPETPTRILLPRRLNPIRECVWRGNLLVVECEYPHGLWSEYTQTPLSLPEGVVLVGAACGDRVVRGGLCYLSPTRFSVASNDVRHPDATHARYLYVPPVTSPAALCDRLTVAARGCTKDAKLAFRYDTRTDRVLLTVAAHLQGSRMRVLPSFLAARLGLSQYSLSVDGLDPFVWPSEPTGLWDYVEMPPGFYGPCHRSMCTGPPLRFGNELEAAVNRLYFPLAKLSGASKTTPHVLVFSDPDGNVLSCDIPCGRYTPHSLAMHLEGEMTRAIQGVTFSVVHEDDRFTFACERTLPSGEVVPAEFGLLFHHPLSVDPARFGFPAQPLSSSSSYTAPLRTRTAHTEGRAVTNLIRVTELEGQKRFVMHATTPPVLTAVFVDDSTVDEAVLQTFVNTFPFAHGFLPGDLVGMAQCAGATVLQSDGSERAVRSLDVRVPPAASCVVLPPRQGDAVHVLRLVLPRDDHLVQPGAAVQLTSRVDPWNMCFCKPKSLPPHVIGYPERAIQWGVDGSVEDSSGRRLPPFVAPNTHCLDHPDYVLLTFSESAGTGLEHTYGGESKHVFCKLSLYPLFREERALPRDTSLLNGNLSRFTIAFWNPDLRTPYRFHGSEFSFSLSFVSALP